MRLFHRFLIVPILVGSLSTSSSSQEPLAGDYNLDGIVDFSDFIANVTTWGFPGSRERFFDLYERWADQANYPPTLAGYNRTLENEGQEPVVYVDASGVAHVFSIRRDPEGAKQIFRRKIYPWGHVQTRDDQLTFREPITAIPGLPPGSPRLDGLRLVVRQNKKGPFVLLYPGYQGKIRFMVFNSGGWQLSEEMAVGDAISNFDSLEGVLDDEGILHVAVMARVEFGSDTREVTYHQFKLDGEALMTSVPLGTGEDSGGGSSERLHPEICLRDDSHAIVLWDQGEGSASTPGDPETFPTKAVLVNTDTGMVTPFGNLTQAWVEPDCEWIPSVGLLIGFQQFIAGPGRHIFFTVLSENTLTPAFNPVQLSPNTSNQSDGAQLARIDGDYYVAWNQEGDRPNISRVATNGSEQGPFTLDGPLGGGLFQGPVRIGVDSEGSAHLVYGTENFEPNGQDHVNYVKTRVE